MVYWVSTFHWTSVHPVHQLLFTPPYQIEASQVHQTVIGYMSTAGTITSFAQQPHEQVWDNALKPPPFLGGAWLACIAGNCRLSELTYPS
jgi:hypothetical protein